MLSGSLRDRSLRSARKSIWWSVICCKRSGSTSQLGAYGQHLLSSYMNFRFAPRFGPRMLERLRTSVRASAVFPRTKAGNLDAIRTATSTRLATRRTKRCLDSSSDTVVLLAFSFCKVVSKLIICHIEPLWGSCLALRRVLPMPSPVTSCHVVSCKILLVVVETRSRSAMKVDKCLWR